MTRLDKVTVYLTASNGREEAVTLENNTDKYYSFAEALKKARARRKISQSQLAQLCGFASPTYVSRIEQGLINPSQKTMQRIVDALGYRLGYVVEPRE